MSLFQHEYEHTRLFETMHTCSKFFIYKFMFSNQSIFYCKHIFAAFCILNNVKIEKRHRGHRPILKTNLKNSQSTGYINSTHRFCVPETCKRYDNQLKQLVCPTVLHSLFRWTEIKSLKIYKNLSFCQNPESYLPKF